MGKQSVREPFTVLLFLQIHFLLHHGQHERSRIVFNSPFQSTFTIIAPKNINTKPSKTRYRCQFILREHSTCFTDLYKNTYSSPLAFCASFSCLVPLTALWERRQGGSQPNPLFCPCNIHNVDKTTQSCHVLKTDQHVSYFLSLAKF